jgi:hypothetical protein
VLRNVPTEGRGVERAGHAQGAAKGSSPLREVEARRHEMQ